MLVWRILIFYICLAETLSYLLHISKAKQTQINRGTCFLSAKGRDRERRKRTSTFRSSEAVESEIVFNSDDQKEKKDIFSRLDRAAKLLYRFSRPHTIKVKYYFDMYIWDLMMITYNQGTILASTMGVSRALMENPGKISLQLVPRALIGLFALLCGNAYIVGINQIYDVKVDEVGKIYCTIRLLEGAHHERIFLS